MNNNSLRPLLPATRPRSPPPSGPSSKRKRVSVACNECRQKRIGCDGARPACAACHRRDRRCVYMNDENLEMRPTILKRENIALRDKLAVLQDIFEHLQGRTQHVAHDTVQRLGAGTNPSDVLKTLRGESPRTALSEQAAARAILPAVHSDCELELLVRHPKAYCVLDLPVVAQDTVSTLFLDDESSHAHVSELEIVKTTKKQSGRPHYCDSRLEKLNIDFWTSVSISNEHAASAISLYLETHHPIWCFFDASQFVDDLVKCRVDSNSTCSPLLVSSMLAFALQGYSSIYPEAAKHSYQFEQQAKKLFAAESTTDTLPTVAAMALLYISIAVRADVPKAMKYLIAAKDAAKRMKLFGEPDPATFGSLKTREAMSQTAWGLFNFLVQMSQFQVVAPLEHPPTMPLPEDLRANQAPDDSHMEEAGNVSPVFTEVQQAHSIFCRLWVIVNEIFLVYRDNKIGARSLAFALGKYHKLLELVSTLPKSMVRADNTPHWVLIFHTILHMVVLDLFRPYIASDEQHGFQAYVPGPSSPKTIFAASVMQLKGILFAFAIQYTPAYWNLALSCAMVFTVNAVLNDVSDKERHNYLAFCISMSQKLLPSYVYMIETIRAILAIATDKGAITTSDAIRIEAQSAAMQRAKLINRSKGGWVVAPTLNDNIAGDINTLTERFETITLFNEFTEDIA
ncbi:DNA binding [Ascochyta rabiei]|uniref:DNA binding n=1 Tax=Didymella rabiei TaxID=5454 RepID=A0A163G0J9_DIDRA|nr:DNA binding [Ascochyta rabiei]